MYIVKSKKGETNEELIKRFEYETSIIRRETKENKYFKKKKTH